MAKNIKKLADECRQMQNKVMMDDDEWLFRVAQLVQGLSPVECQELMRELGGSLPTIH